MKPIVRFFSFSFIAFRPTNRSVNRKKDNQFVEKKNPEGSNGSMSYYRQKQGKP